MKKIICDICKKEEASRGMKVKMRRKYPDDWDSCQHWGRYRKIDICGNCATKLLGMEYIDSEGNQKPYLPEINE